MIDNSLDKSSVTDLQEYFVVTANKRRIIQTILSDDEFYEAYKKNKLYALHVYRHYKDLLERDGISILGLEHVDPNKKTFFCSFHLGPLLLVPFTMSWLELDSVLVLSQVAKSKVTSYEQMNRSVNTDKMTDVVFGDTREGLVSILKGTGNKRNYLSFVDLGMGTNDIGISKNSVEILLNGIKIFARTGIPFLAHKLGMSITPVLAHFVDNEVVIEFKEAFRAPAAAATTKLWQIFAEELDKFPTQWESLHSIHQYFNYNRSLDVDPMEGQANAYRFNKLRFELFERGGINLIFDVKTSKTFRVSDNLYAFLRNVSENDISFDDESLEYFVKNTDFRNFLTSQQIITS